MSMNSLLCLALMAGPGLAAAGSEMVRTERPRLWIDPVDLESRDLRYGIGGEAHLPKGPFTFIEEDMGGNSPKFTVKDARGDKWKVKVGAEARPETAVTRFIWAVGYHTDEDYYLPEQKVEGMPRKLKRGARHVTDEGVVLDARWERQHEKKVGKWKWRKNPYTGTAQLNGLRVLMAIFNNWDLKDSQNAIYETASGPVMLVADLGATLGPTYSRWPIPTARGDEKVYKRTRFVTKVHDGKVDFGTPSWPKMFGFLPTIPFPYTTITQPMRLFGKEPAANLIVHRYIGRGIPTNDARWLGELLARLSARQIRDGFQAAGYSTDQAESFAQTLEARIAELKAL